MGSGNGKDMVLKSDDGARYWVSVLSVRFT